MDGILSSLRSGQPRKIVSNLGRGKKLFSSPEGRKGPTQPPIRWLLGDFSPAVKRREREAKYLPPSSAEVN